MGGLVLSKPGTWQKQHENGVSFKISYKMDGEKNVSIAPGLYFSIIIHYTSIKNIV